MYHKIEIHQMNKAMYKNSKTSELLDRGSQNNKYSDEYGLIIATNKIIAREFIEQLHEYRSNNVNASNLKLDQMYNPQKLYNYLNYLNYN